MALVRGLADSLRGTILSRLQLPAQSALATVGAPASLYLFRGFAEGTYLDKNQVTERILNVVKNFDKVDGAKVKPMPTLSWSLSASIVGFNSICATLTL